MSHPWFAFYPRDYRDKTSGLTMVQDGAYRRLMDEYYLTGEPLPANAEILLRVCRAFDDAEKAAVLFVLPKYFVEGDDGWHHLRIDEEIVKRADLSAKRAASGKFGAAKTNENKAKKPVQQLPTHSHPHTQDTTSLRSVVEQPKASKRTRKSLPEESPTVTDRQWAQNHWLKFGRADLCDAMTEEIEKFRDHHRGKLTASADWPASWRTWVRNAIKFNNGGHNGRKFPSKVDNFLDGGASFIADLRAENRPPEGRASFEIVDEVGDCVQPKLVA